MSEDMNIQTSADQVAVSQYKARELSKLLMRAYMALLCYTQSHGTPCTQLINEIAVVLSLDADGNPLRG